MRTKVVEYQDGDRAYRLVVAEATALVGLKRTLLRGSGMAWAKQYRDGGPAPVDAPGGASEKRATQTAEVAEVAGEETRAAGGAEARERSNGRDPLTISAASIMAQVIYPDLVAATVESDGLDVGHLSIDQFILLDERLVGAWEDAVYDLNPHWLPGADAGPGDTQEKKA